MSLFWNSAGRRPAKPSTLHARLSVEELETRIVPYALIGGAWLPANGATPQLITISFVPDGTLVSSGTGGNVYSNTFAKFNAKFGSSAAWEDAILSAAQLWAQVANVNFSVVSDNGTAAGQGNYQQGDPGMGDIRIASYAMSSGNILGLGYYPPPVNNYSIAGDIDFNSNVTYNINGSSYDLEAVALHEIGHALGLDESTVPTAAMYGAYHGALRALSSDDIAGIQSIYGPRASDAYDGGSNPNNSFASAANISGQINPTLGTGQLTNLDISTSGQAEFYEFTTPLLSGNTLTVSAQSSGLSLLRPSLTLYAADQTTVLGTASATGSYNGGTETVTYNAGLLGSVANQTFYVKVTGADTTAFGTGAYDLSMSMGLLSSLPAVTPPNTESLNGTIFNGGGGAPQLVELNPDGGDFLTADGTDDDPPPPPPPPGWTGAVAGNGQGSHAGVSEFTDVSHAIATAVAAPALPASIQGSLAVAPSVPAVAAIHNGEQGLSQMALAIAPLSASVQPGTALEVPTMDFQNVHVATSVFQDGQTQARTVPTTPAVPATQTSSGEVTDEVTAPETPQNEKDVPAPETPQATPVAPTDRVAPVPAEVTIRQLATDAVFTDPVSLAALGLRRTDDRGLGEGTFTIPTPTEAGAEGPAASSAGEGRGTSPALAGFALFAGAWWFAGSASEETRSRSAERMKDEG